MIRGHCLECGTLDAASNQQRIGKESMVEPGGRNRMGVSIALATFNGEAHIMEQLESLAAQTVQPFEIVITDDGSTDNTLAIAAKFAEKVSFPVRIYRNEQRLLFADNFLRAASLCEADLIAFCDQDDLWRPEKLESSLAFFCDPGVLLSVHTSEVWDGTKTNGSLYPVFSRSGVHEPLTLDPFELVPGFVMILRRELLHITQNDRRLRNVFTLGKEARPMGHDQWVWFLASIFGKVATSTVPQALYRQHAANVVGAPKKSGWFYGVTLSLSAVDYEGLAELERAAILCLREIADREDEARRESCLKGIAKLRNRQTYHEARAAIYDQRNHLLRRIREFTRIFRTGGYHDDAAGYCLGRKAALKDLAFGVTGFYKMVGASQQSSL